MFISHLNLLISSLGLSKSLSFRNPRLFILGFSPFGFKLNQNNNKRANVYPYLTNLPKDWGCFLDDFSSPFFFPSPFTSVLAGPYALQTSRFYGSAHPNYSSLIQVFRVYSCKVFFRWENYARRGRPILSLSLVLWPNVREKKRHELLFSMYLYSLITFLLFVYFSPSFHNIFNIYPSSFPLNILVLKHFLVFIPILS
jgi:hypothetical protein